MPEKDTNKHPGEESPVKKAKSAGEPAETSEEVQTETEPDPLEALKAENAALADRNLRLMAEYDNYRKRTQRERENIYPDAIASVLTNFLPILDNFQRALEAPCADEAYAKGVEMIYTTLWETMKNQGVEEIAKVGDSFDPNLHNAVLHIDDGNEGENVITQVLQKGYKIGGRVLRHAMVQVAN